MTFTLYSDKAQYSPSAAPVYSVSLSADKDICGLKLELIPCAEAFPDAFIVPELSAVTVSPDSVSVKDAYEKDGIYSLELELPHLKEVQVQIPSSVSDRAPQSNTASLIADIAYSDSTHEDAYSQLTLAKHTPLPLTAALAVAVMLVSAVIIYLLKRLYFTQTQS